MNLSMEDLMAAYDAAKNCTLADVEDGALYDSKMRSLPSTYMRDQFRIRYPTITAPTVEEFRRALASKIFNDTFLSAVPQEAYVLLYCKRCSEDPTSVLVAITKSIAEMSEAMLEESVRLSKL